MIRIAFLSIGLLAGCTQQSENPTEFMGEPLHSGSNDEVVDRTIDHAKLSPVFSEFDGGTEGIQVFQKGTGVPYVGLTDSNGDGVFDFLSISVLDEHGMTVVEIEDFQLDGQPDLRVWSDGQAEVFYQDEWRAVLGGRSLRYIEVDGQKLSFLDLIADLGRP